MGKNADKRVIRLHGSVIACRIPAIPAVVEAPMRRIKYLTVLALTLLVLISGRLSVAQNNLQVTFGSQGVQTLSYYGVVLEDLSKNGSDAFHIWHMKMTDLRGNVATCSQCGWGESRSEEHT